MTLTGESRSWERIADSGNRTVYSFCPVCGSTVAYVGEGFPGLTAVPVGAFADPDFPRPRFSVYEHRKHAWVEITGDEVEHSRTPSAVRRPGIQQAGPERD